MLQLVVSKSGMEMFNDGLKRAAAALVRRARGAQQRRDDGGCCRRCAPTERFPQRGREYPLLIFRGGRLRCLVRRCQTWLLIPVFGIGVGILGGLTGLLSQRIKAVQRFDRARDPRGCPVRSRSRFATSSW